MSRTRTDIVGELVWTAFVLAAFAIGYACGRDAARRPAPLPTPAASAAGEQHAPLEDARSAVPARRGFPTYLPSGSVSIGGARIEHESERMPSVVPAAGRERISSLRGGQVNVGLVSKQSGGAAPEARF